VNAGSVARRYARALFELATQRGVVDEVQEQLDLFAAAVMSIAVDSIAPGVLSLEGRLRVAEKVGAKFGADSLFGRFVRVLAANDRLVEAPRIGWWYATMKDAAQGRVRASVASAVPLEDGERKSIEETFGRVVGKRVIAETSVDASLLGGVVVELEGRVYDGSVRSAFRRLSQRMAGSSERAAG
jgi:F-type H+-transporting ATPase subunit delta